MTTLVGSLPECLGQPYATGATVASLVVPDDAIVVARKQPNVLLEVSALFYRPWQYYNMLISAQEYKVTDKIYFGSDFPAARVEESVDGLLNINDQVEGTKLPRLDVEQLEAMIHRDSLALLGL